MYVVKDLVPDMTLFYKQYKSIQPWLQNDNPPAQGMFMTPYEVTYSTPLNQANIFNPRRTVGSLTECTSAFYAHAAPLPARPTGGTKTNTLGRLL